MYFLALNNCHFSLNELKKREYNARNIAARIFASLSQGRNRVVRKKSTRMEKTFSFLNILSVKKGQQEKA
jgi:hypothetical protein